MSSSQNPKISRSYNPKTATDFQHEVQVSRSMLSVFLPSFLTTLHGEHHLTHEATGHS